MMRWTHNLIRDKVEWAKTDKKQQEELFYFIFCEPIKSFFVSHKAVNKNLRFESARSLAEEAK